jgi:hypothetical protein
LPAAVDQSAAGRERQQRCHQLPHWRWQLLGSRASSSKTRRTAGLSADRRASPTPAATDVIAGPAGARQSMLAGRIGTLPALTPSCGIIEQIDREAGLRGASSVRPTRARIAADLRQNGGAVSSRAAVPARRSTPRMIGMDASGCTSKVWPTSC